MKPLNEITQEELFDLWKEQNRETINRQNEINRRLLNRSSEILVLLRKIIRAFGIKDEA